MSAQGTARSEMDAADRAASSRPVERLARVGLLAYGVVHLLVAWLALQLAWGSGGEETDQSGAMSTLARQPLGRPLLVLIGVGLLALAVWQAAEVFRWRNGLTASGKERTRAVRRAVRSVAKAAVYLVLAVLAARFAFGGGQSTAARQQHATAGVLGLPGGRFLVAGLGLILLAVGGTLVYKGVRKSFLKQVDLADAPPHRRRLITRLGQAGFPAKGVSLALVGGLFGYAALTADPGKARGLDGALRTVVGAPFGQLLLTLIALGIAAFGVFCFARARYPERT